MFFRSLDVVSSLIRTERGSSVPRAVEPCLPDLVETRHDPLDERLAHLLRLLQGPPSDPEDRCERLLRALRKPSDHDDVALLIAQAHPLKT